jgi:hypothetical protein
VVDKYQNSGENIVKMDLKRFLQIVGTYVLNHKESHPKIEIFLLYM